MSFYTGTQSFAFMKRLLTHTKWDILTVKCNKLNIEHVLNWINLITRAF